METFRFEDEDDYDKESFEGGLLQFSDEKYRHFKTEPF